MVVCGVWCVVCGVWCVVVVVVVVVVVRGGGGGGVCVCLYAAQQISIEKVPITRNSRLTYRHVVYPSNSRLIYRQNRFFMLLLQKETLFFPHHPPSRWKLE